jgi:DNA repair protein RadC
LLLTYAIPQKDVKPIALELLQKYGSLDQIFKASIHDLCQITGLKESSAILIKLVDWFKTVQGTKIDSPESIAAINDQQLALFSDVETQYKKNFYFCCFHKIGLTVRSKKINGYIIQPYPAIARKIFKALDPGQKKSIKVQAPIRWLFTVRLHFKMYHLD